jgi:hypothetical protein
MQNINNLTAIFPSNNSVIFNAKYWLNLNEKNSTFSFRVNFFFTGLGKEKHSTHT